MDFSCCRELWVRKGGMGPIGIAKTLPSTGWSQSLLQRGYKSQSAFKTLTLQKALKSNAFPSGQRPLLKFKTNKLHMLEIKLEAGGK